MIPLSSPDIRAEDIERVVDVLRTGQLVQGPHVAQLEEATREYLGTAEAVAVSSGTATLHLALRALEVGPGDDVIVPAFSHVATANVVELVGARPVFVDIDLETFNIDVRQIADKVTPRTRAILPVHEFGLMCDMEEVGKLAERHGLPVVEDAACALGARLQGVNAGTLGAFGSFSLHPRKAITSGEGGLLTTNDRRLASAVRALRNHGIDPDQANTDFVCAGFNYRLTDFQAALAASQLPRLEAAIERRTEIAELYRRLLNSPRVRLPSVPPGARHTYQTFHILLDPAVDRPALIANLKASGIGSNYGAQCIPAQTHYRRKYGHDAAREFPRAYRAYTSGLAIPMFEKMSDDDVAQVAQTLNRLS